MNNAGATPPSAMPTEAGAGVKAAYHGNPLCHVDLSTDCSPDEDMYRLNTSDSCEKPALDAGDASVAGGDLKSGACRVTGDDGGIGPHCSSANVDGIDGASCQVGADCAGGFDCVAGETGAKACRHYCCAGTCKGQLSQNGGGTFCDVQSLADFHQKAPVCLPIKQCELLGTGQCANNESCAVVTESGDTGCVAVGEQQVGASCDIDHCAAQLTCLGQPGSRKCYKLCKVSSSDCGASMVCETSTIFKDPMFGTCGKPAPR